MFSHIIGYSPVERGLSHLPRGTVARIGNSAREVLSAWLTLGAPNCIYVLSLPSLLLFLHLLFYIKA